MPLVGMATSSSERTVRLLCFLHRRSSLLLCSLPAHMLVLLFRLMRGHLINSH